MTIVFTLPHCTHFIPRVIHRLCKSRNISLILRDLILMRLFRLPYLHTQHEYDDQDRRNDSHETKQELIEAFVEKRMRFLLNGFILIGGLVFFARLVEIHSLQYTTYRKPVGKLCFPTGFTHPFFSTHLRLSPSHLQQQFLGCTLQSYLPRLSCIQTVATSSPTKYHPLRQEDFAGSPVQTR